MTKKENKKKPDVSEADDDTLGMSTELTNAAPREGSAGAAHAEEAAEPATSHTFAGKAEHGDFSGRVGEAQEISVGSATGDFADLEQRPGEFGLTAVEDARLEVERKKPKSAA